MGGICDILQGERDLPRRRLALGGRSVTTGYETPRGVTAYKIFHRRPFGGCGFSAQALQPMSSRIWRVVRCLAANKTFAEIDSEEE